KGYRAHFENISARFRRSLYRSWKNDEFSGISEDELDTISFTLLASREYLFNKFMTGDDLGEDALGNIIGTYLKFISFGLTGLGRQDKPSMNSFQTSTVKKENLKKSLTKKSLA